ncbi:MAG: AMP-binding protein [Pseudomonadota bacterium]
MASDAENQSNRAYNVTLAESFFPAQVSSHYEARTIHGLIKHQAQAIGNQKALREILDDASIGREWTYAELHEDAEKLARALGARHPIGARVAVFAHNIPEWILMELATAYAGLILVTVNPSYGVRELKYVLEQSKAEAIYFVESVRGHALRPTVEAACAELPNIKHQILLTDHNALFANYEAGDIRPGAPDANVQIQYTSGTTGFPKGALLHQKGLIQNADDILARLKVDTGDRFVLHMPLFHTAGCAILVLGGFARGAEIMLMSVFDPHAAIEVVARERANMIFGVPTMLVALIETAEKSGKDFSSVRTIMSGGSMVPPDLVKKSRQVFGTPILIIYGQTEASPGITSTWDTDADDDLFNTIGQPYPHMDVAVLEPGSNTIMPIGEQGELCCRGYNVMTGYNDNPEATAATIDADGWLRTGDLGRMDARGYVRITGRVKEMIIRGGENLFPAEIENALLEHPAISEICIVGIPDDKWGELVACFMRGPGEKPEPAELKAFVRERLSPQKTPAFWIWVDDWPLTGSGKIQRFVLRDQFIDGQFRVLTA